MHTKTHSPLHMWTDIQKSYKVINKFCSCDQACLNVLKIYLYIEVDESAISLE